MAMLSILLLIAAVVQLAAAGCPSGYTVGSLSKSCYVAVKENTTSRTDAANRCATRGGHLVYLDSAEKQAEVATYFAATFPDSLSGSVQSVWIGACRTITGKFEWSDKCAQGGPPAGAIRSPVSYTNWNTGEPNNQLSAEWCVHAYTSGPLKLTWNDKDCTKAVGTYYICETSPSADCPAPPKPTSCDVPVAPDYNGILLQQHYYKEGSTFFNRTFVEYAGGFGTHDGNYWIGNNAIHTLTNYLINWKLRIDVLTRESNCVWYNAVYSKFKVGEWGDKYTLSIGGYSGTLSDVVAYADANMGWANSDTMKFTTFDQDNDMNGFPVYNNCVKCTNGNTCGAPGGAWWHRSCSGVYINGPDSNFAVYAKPNGKASYEVVPLTYSRLTLVP